MLETAQGISMLLLKYVKNELSDEERQKLNEWVNESDAHRKLFEQIADENSLNILVKEYYSFFTEFEESGWAKVVPIEPRRRTRFLYIAAASVVLLISIAAFYFIYQYKSKKELAKVPAASLPAKQDVLPGGNKAVLVLGDGSSIQLDDSKNGAIAQQGQTSIQKKQDGLIAYNAGKTLNEHVAYNTVVTPRGGQYEVILPDGSHVWLNAASSIRFPAAFTGNERKVEITGELYFEVAHATSPATGKRVPFKVVIAPSPSGEGRGEVEVLGTHFNINAYSDEAMIRTTLLEGAVKITPPFSGGSHSEVLKPGQQSQVDETGNIKVVKEADIDEVMAWKNGLFVYNNTNIQVIMRQIERWYDLQTVYENDKVKKWEFNGEISRYSNVSKVLDLLQATESVRFKIEGKKIIVSSK